MLNLPGIKQLFKHSQKVNIGVGCKRTGQATRIVALDGTGDFDSIQEAINDLPNSGGVVYIKEGIYKINSLVNITKNNIALVGSGKATQIKKGPLFTVAQPLFSASSKSNLIIRDIYFNQSNTEGRGIYFNNTINSFIGFCWFENGALDDIDLAFGSNNNIIMQNRSTGDGFKIVGSNQNIIIGNVITSTVYGLEIINNSSNNIITGNIFNSNSESGILINANITGNCDRNLVHGNICQNNDYGIRIIEGGFTANRNLVHGNICNSNTTGQITDNGTNTTVADNVVL